MSASRTAWPISRQMTVLWASLTVLVGVPTAAVISDIANAPATLQTAIHVSASIAAIALLFLGPTKTGQELPGYAVGLWSRFFSGVIDASILATAVLILPVQSLAESLGPLPFIAVWILYSGFHTWRGRPTLGQFGLGFRTRSVSGNPSFAEAIGNAMLAPFGFPLWFVTLLDNWNNPAKPPWWNRASGVRAVTVAHR